MKRRILRPISLLVVLLILLSMFSLLSACSDEVKFKSFTADETYFIAGEKSNVTFSAEVSKNVEYIQLYSSINGNVSKMYDNGSNGDAVAKDGIYSCTVSVFSEKNSAEDFCAKTSGVESKIITISFYAKPTVESKDDVVEFQTKIDAVESNFVDEKGYVTAEEVPQVLERVEECVEPLLETGEVSAYEITSSSVVINWSTGLTSVYAPEIENTYGMQRDSELTVSVYQPYFEWVSTIDDDYISLPSNVSNEALLLDSASESIRGVLPNTVCNSNRDDAVSLSVLETFQSNQIILWQGHGVYGGKDIHSLICTGNAFNWDAWLFDANYFIDCCKNLIVEYNGNETFSSKYIDKYCDELDNTIVYLGPCQSGYDSVLAEAFLNKGAKAVVANTETILCLYGDMVQYSTMNLMTQINPETDDYYSLSEALAESKRIYGQNDSIYGGIGAEPVIFGGSEAENYRLGKYIPIYATDFSIPSEIQVTLGELCVIEPEISPADSDSFSIKWSSSDESVATVSPTGEAGIITTHAKGNVTITAELTSGEKTITKTTKLTVDSKARDTVLVLDVSGSMSGEPLDEMKKSAIQFCNDLLKDKSNNRVGIVFYDDRVTKIELTNNLENLIKVISAVDDNGRTDMEAGLSAANDMLLNSGRTGAIKNVVIMADGIPNEGEISNSGSLPKGSYSTATESVLHANAVIDTAKEMMKNYNLYSLGFFHDLSGVTKEFATALMKELTNQPDGYHQVDRAEDLQFAFGDISDEINLGSKIVINIACPVDVTVTYGGETLSSATNSFNGMTSFGSLQLMGKDKDIKVVSLDSDKIYDIRIVGTGDGKMDYTVNYFDENEQLYDYRSFETVPITTQTVITSTTDNASKDVELNIDNNGDGETDVIMTALVKSKAVISYEREPSSAPSVPEEPPKDEKTPIIVEPEENFELPETTAIVAAAIAFVLISIGGVILVIMVSSGERKRESYLDVPIKKADVPIENKVAKREIIPETEPLTTGMIQITSGRLNGFCVPIKDGETLYLGKDANVANLVFTSDYKKVSRLHCSVTYDAKIKAYFVVDCSSNGTYVDLNKRLIKGKRTKVAANSIIVLADGECTVLLR